jgi:hypothetical protein
MLALFLAAGLLGLMPLILLDWLLEWAFGFSPVLWLKDRAIRAGLMGETTGTIADTLMRGLPALLQVDISGRVGMGAGFVPRSVEDLTLGPALGTVKRLRELAEKDREEIVDYLNAISPAANPLRVLEAAANGATIDSREFWSLRGFGDGQTVFRNPSLRGMPEYNMTNRELVAQGAGFRPLRSSLYADAREALGDQAKDRRKDVNDYVQEIVQARRNNRPDRENRIREEAAAAGVRIPPQTVIRALRDSQMERQERDVRRAPIPLREDARDRLRAIDARRLGDQRPAPVQ